jgi:uncharacterized protein YbaR (Trm112 family)
MPVSKDLLDILRCPACVSGPNRDKSKTDPGQLDFIREKWLVCRDCSRKYPVRNDIPVMLIEEGDKHRATEVDSLGEP